MPVDVARGAAHGLDERRLGAEEALLVGVEDGDERDFRQVEPLAQEVDADEHVELAAAQVAEYLDALKRLDVRVEVADADADLGEVFGEVFGHLLRQRGDEDALVPLGARADFAEQVVDLPLDGSYLDYAGRSTPSGG